MIQSGQLIEFLNKNDVMVGVCQQVNAGQVRVLTEQNKEINLLERKILHLLKHKPVSQLSRLDKVQIIKDWSQRFQTQPLPVDLHALWEVLLGETEALSLSDLVGMYFNQDGDAEHSSLLRALIADRVYFERKGDDGFHARSEDKVKLILEQQEREQQKLLSRESTIHWIKQTISKHIDTPMPEASKPFLPALIDVAVRQQQSSQFSTISQLFQAANCTGRTEELCLQLLIHSGIWDEDINLQLLEYEVPVDFNAELLQWAGSLQLDLEKMLPTRQDLRALHTVTIDDEETTDIDDALSCEQLADGSTRLWIHIADPATWIAPDSPMDVEAAKRFTSIYLCEGKIEMLPASLSQSLCSLVQGEPRLAVTVLAHLDAEGQILSSEIIESIIEVKRRMSYSEVDQELETEPGLKHLFELAQKLKAKRLEQGAVDFTRPELRIKVMPDKQIQIKRIDRESPAQKLVSELMILANYLVAKQMIAAQIPLLYKVQEAPVDTMSDGRPMLKRAEMTTRPGLHYGLGLDAYAQFTSPIRRFQDLVLHRQIKSWLQTGVGYYTEDALSYMIALSDRALNTASIIQRENFRYWLLKYFSQLPEPRLLTATLSNMKEEKVWLNLTDYCYDVPLPAAEFAACKIGDSVVVSIEQAHARRNRLVLRRVSNPENQ